MQLTSVGVDIIALARLSRVLRRNPKLFMPLCRSEEQPELCSADGEGLYRAACLWTVKEATAKCLGTGFWRHSVEWTDVLVQDIKLKSLSHCSIKNTFMQNPHVISVAITLSGAAKELYPCATLKGQFELLLSEVSREKLEGGNHSLLMGTSLHGLARVQMYRPTENHVFDFRTGK